MNQLTKTIIKVPILGRLMLIIYRAKLGLWYFQGRLWNLFTWLFRSREITNFTYDLEATNKRYLASLIAHVTNENIDIILSYFKEIETDNNLIKHIADLTKKHNSAILADKKMYFSRRIGWYAFARVLKPKNIIETGVDKGLGSCILTSALKRNHQEGHKGQYYGTDINPEAGYLLAGEYENYGRILYGDSIESLKKFNGSIDLFINDSDHASDYESEEYKTIAKMLSDNAVILGDNSGATNELLDFSLKMNRDFVFFQEKPKEHWYPGGGIGISFKKGQMPNKDGVSKS